MNEDESQSRFSALVSGTAAAHFKPALLMRRQNQALLAIPTRPMSPAFLIRNSRSRPHVPGLMITNEGHSVGLMQGTNRNEAQSLHTMESSTHAVHSRLGSTDMAVDAERQHRQYETHTSRETTVASSRIPRAPPVASAMPKAHPRRDLPQLKTRKSLKQRFGPSDDNATPSSDPIDPPEVSQVQNQQDHFPQQAAEVVQNLPYGEVFPSRSHSRSMSIVSSVFSRQQGQDDDISSIMMRGATDLRNAKFEIEEQRREISSLQSQLETLRNEKEDMLQRLNAVKKAAKQGIESSSKSLEDMRATLDTMKAQSNEYAAFISVTKASLVNVDDLRLTVDEVTKSIEPLISDEGRMFKAEDTRRIIKELQVDCERSRQVSDLLRERLQSIGAELVESKSRVNDLENSQSADRLTLSQLTQDLSQAIEQNATLNASSKRKQDELYDTFVYKAELEAKLIALQEQEARLKELVGKKDCELGTLLVVREENVKLQTLLEERNAVLDEKSTLEKQIESIKAISLERLNRINLLETTVVHKDQTIADHAKRIDNVEKSLQESRTEVVAAQQSLHANHVREQAITKELDHARIDLAEAKQKLSHFETQLREANRELDRRIQQAHEADTKAKVLEERFEDQSVTLRLMKEANGDMHERLIESEAKFARELEASTQKLDCELALLTEQKSTSLARVHDLKEAARLQEQCMAALKTEYEARIKTQEEAWQRQLAAEEKRHHDATKALEDAQAMAKDLDARLISGKEESDSLKEELRQAKLPSPAHKDEVETLNTQLTALRSQITDLTLRAQNIDERYRVGDLNDEEKSFINKLVHTSQTVHEEELISRGNELRRRDNTIKELQARIKLLESKLAKHLDSQTKTNIVTTNASLIDPSAWVGSSELSSSPLTVPNEDITSTNVDTTTTTAKPTPAPVRVSARPPLAPVPLPAPNIMVRTPRHSRLLRATAAGAKNTPLPAALKTTPAAARVNTQQQQQQTPYALGRPSLLGPRPKSPAANSGSAPRPTVQTVRAVEKPAFTRLATDASDDILEFEDKPSQQLLSPIQGGSPSDQPLARMAKPGKRAKSSDGISPAGSQGHSRLAKRPRTRSRADAHGEPREGGASKISPKPIPMLQKTRTRRRR